MFERLQRQLEEDKKICMNCEGYIPITERSGECGPSIMYNPILTGDFRAIVCPISRCVFLDLFKEKQPEQNKNFPFDYIPEDSEFKRLPIITNNLNARISCPHH